MRTPLRRVSLVVALALVAWSARAHAAPDLSPQRAAEKAAANEPAPAGAVSAPAPSSTKLWLKRSAWIAGAGAGIATGVAVFSFFRHDGKIEEYNRLRNEAGTARCSTDFPQEGGPHCAALHEEANSARRLSFGALAASAILGLASGTLAIVAANQSAVPAVALAPGEVAASWRLRF